MSDSAFPSVFLEVMVEEIDIKRFVQDDPPNDVDEYGRPNGSFVPVATVKARISSRGISENRENKERITQRRAASVHPDTDVLHTDRIDYFGYEWEIETVEGVYSHEGLAYKRIIMVRAD